MSGHSKWAQIKRQKAVTDAKRSKAFGKLARLISTESRLANGNTDAPALRAAIEKAKKENMPSDNIERAVKKGIGGEGGTMEPVLYEAYGPGGCAIIIEGLTDSKNRTSAEMKHLLSKNGLALAGQGAAVWAFEKTNEGWGPKTMMPLSDEDAEKLEKLIEEIEGNDDVQEVYTNAE